MIVLLDTSHDLSTCSEELGCEVGTLLTPLTRYTLREPNRPWAIDNGAYARFNAKSFQSLLERESERRAGCLFVAVPDVVGSARRTCEVFQHWVARIGFGWKLAFVCQDGQEELPIPWNSVSAIFIGGSTNWKMSRHAVACVQAAKALGKWVHIGRVNDPDRLDAFETLGADSVDGTGLSRYTHMREKIQARYLQGKLNVTV